MIGEGTMKRQFLPLIVGAIFTCTFSAFAASPALDQQLAAAVSTRHLAAIKELLDKGANPNTTSKKEGTPILFEAAGRGHTETVRLLLEKGAKPDLPLKSNGATALLIAANNGHTEIVTALLEAGAYIDTCTKKGFTALAQASRQGHAKVVEVLLAKGADHNITPLNGQTPLILASNAGHTHVVSLLLDRKPDVNSRDDAGHTALLHAVAGGFPEVVKLLLVNGADINARDHNARTPLMLAVDKRYPSVVRILVEAGADISLRDTKGRSVVDYAGSESAFRTLARGMSLLDGTSDAVSESGARGRTFLLTRQAVACDSLRTTKELFVAAATRSTDFGRRVTAAVEDGRARMLPKGTPVVLTGKGTDAVTEVVVQGTRGTWWLPNQTLKEAKTLVGQPDMDYFIKQMDMNR